MSTYYTLLTNLGAALHANAQVMQTTVPWTHMCLGDGGGAPVVPMQTQTALKREVHRLAITDIAQHPDNPSWLIVEAVVPSDVGGWTVRETAIYGGANGAQCIAVGNYPETYKPVLAEGAAREMVMRMVVEISSTATVKLTIDPAVAIASRAWVESLVATPQKRGLVKLATVDEAVAGERHDVAVTPEGLGAALAEVGGLPRFTPYLWAGRGDAMPQGDTQSSGQQLPDLMYPTMRRDVVASQFYCTEQEWQDDPYKRVTHWSTGDGASWMRPPDKNGVEEGNVGAFYGAGSNPAGARAGTAVIDAMRNLVGHFVGGGRNAENMPANRPLGVFSVANADWGSSHPTQQTGNDTEEIYRFSAADGLPAGTTTDPVTGEFRPRTWYGVWMIRMYGRVTNVGDLNAPALNARMDMIDARLSTLEGLSNFRYLSKSSVRAWDVVYTNGPKRRKVKAGQHTDSVVGTRLVLSVWVGGMLIGGSNGTASTTPGSNVGNTLCVDFEVPPGATYSVSNSGSAGGVAAGSFFWLEAE